jgi:hypothetical protein
MQTHDVLDERAAADDDGFYPDDALPTHHLDEDHDGRQRGICPHSGGVRTDTGGCPRGCAGATEHYSNDGHRDCYDPAPVRGAGRAER